MANPTQRERFEAWYEQQPQQDRLFHAHTLALRAWQAAEAGQQELVEAAIGWWESRRPVVWDQAKHAANPTINCCTQSEDSLARAVATYKARADGGKT